MPYVIDPPRGWIASANNRVTSRNVRVDVASDTLALSARPTRIEEMLRSLIEIKSGEITIQDMLVMQCDTVDVYARESLRHVVPVT